MRTSEEIKAEIEDKFGFFPPFFSPAQHNPQVLENLWQQTLIAYINNPLSAVFKEKLSAYLSRFCSVPYCMISHSCTLRPLGLDAHEVLALLDSPPPIEEEIEHHLDILANHPSLMTDLPQPHSALEESLLICSIFIFLEREDADLYRAELRRILGWDNYQHLASFAAYVKTCHVWMEANPEVSYEADKRVQDNFAPQVEQEPALAEFFRTYKEKVKRERLNRAVAQAEQAERRRNMAVLRESEDRYRRLVELSPDTILIQSEGKIVFINSAGAKLLGATSPEQIIGKAVLNFVHENDRPIVQERVNQLQAGNAVPSIEETFVRLDGTTVSVEAVASPFTYQGKLAAQVVIHDISDRKTLERERLALLEREQAARTEAEKANRSKDEFLAVVSHELRSPLNAIMGWAKLLRSRKFDEATTSKALETIERNATMQNQLIEDLLDISRIVHGKVKLNLYPTNLASVVTAALDTVNLAAAAKNIQLISHLDQSSLVAGDAQRLQQVVWNLLTNAIKFTPQGGLVEVQLAVTSDLPSKYVQITVRDTGKGIESEFLPFVFNRFQQADSTSTRSHGGLGLGLAIVRQLVEMHGGTIDVASPGAGLGATFTVSLPLLEASSEDAAQPLIPLSCALSLEGLQILVVDDEADMREYVVTVLKQFGAQVISATSAAQALNVLQSTQLDILVSDIGMPQEDGYTLIRKVRALAAKNAQIRAIALTAYARAEDRSHALESGFQVHLAKPITPTELVTAIANLHKAQRQLLQEV